MSILDMEMPEIQWCLSASANDERSRYSIKIWGEQPKRLQNGSHPMLWSEDITNFYSDSGDIIVRAVLSPLDHFSSRWPGCGTGIAFHTWEEQVELLKEHPSIDIQIDLCTETGEIHSTYNLRALVDDIETSVHSIGDNKYKTVVLTLTNIIYK